jgi:hypothetical protein
MFPILFATSLINSTIPSLPRDDTYHQFTATNGANLTFWIQPWPDHAEVICVHDSNYTYLGYTSSAFDTTWSPIATITPAPRKDAFVESRFSFNTDDPVLFSIGCLAQDCPMVLNYVHTDPVYRTSSVIGAFSLFVCLFLFVFSWTLFCGACRATRKT